MFGRKNARIAELQAERDVWQRGAEYWETMYDEAYARGNELLDKLNESESAAFGAHRTAAMYKKLYEGACRRLTDIASLETPGCAHVGKRMARLARAELPLLHHDAAHSKPANDAAVQGVPTAV